MLDTHPHGFGPMQTLAEGGHPFVTAVEAGRSVGTPNSQQARSGWHF